MKKVPKKLLDEFLQESRIHWFEEENYEVATSLARQLQKATNTHWLGWKDFVNSLLYPSGLSRAVTNEQIYEILKILGWEVVDE